MDQADIDERHKEGLTRDERAELVWPRHEKRVVERVFVERDSTASNLGLSS